MTKFIPSNSPRANDSAPAESHPVPCWISFGGNVGDVHATFDAALKLLGGQSQLQLGRRSGIYRTVPMGAQAGQSFLNSVCELITSLSPHVLLSVLQSVENQLGRIRDVRWGPRTLDLDLLNYGQQIIDEPDLVVPHPALTYRRFVLDPLVEVDAHWLHPACSLSAAELLGRLEHRPLRVALVDVPRSQVEQLTRPLALKFPDLQWIDDSPQSAEVLPIQLNSSSSFSRRAVVDVRRSPGDPLEQLTAAFTSIFDRPQRISAW